MLSLNVGCGGDTRGTIRLDIKPFSAVNILGSVEYLPFRNSVMPRIIFKSVLEHVNNPHLALSETRRVLASNGIIEIGVPKEKFTNNSIYCIVIFILNLPVSLLPRFIRFLSRRIRKIKNRDPAVYHKHIVTRRAISEHFNIVDTSGRGDLLYRFLNYGRKAKYFRNKPRIYSSYLFTCTLREVKPE